jgi:hypothetical protein
MNHPGIYRLVVHYPPAAQVSRRLFAKTEPLLPPPTMTVRTAALLELPAMPRLSACGYGLVGTHQPPERARPRWPGFQETRPHPAAQNSHFWGVVPIKCSFGPEAAFHRSISGRDIRGAEQWPVRPCPNIGLLMSPPEWFLLTRPSVPASDATKDIGYPVREHGPYGSHPMHDDFDDEPGPDGSGTY